MAKIQRSAPGAKKTFARAGQAGPGEHATAWRRLRAAATLTVFTLAADLADPAQAEAPRVELRNLTYEAQRDIMFFICDRLPRVVGMARATGNGGGYLRNSGYAAAAQRWSSRPGLNLCLHAERDAQLSKGVRGLQHRAVRCTKARWTISLDQGRERIPVIVTKGRKA
ncbi:hypothetical protein P4050_16565 [Pseudomonas aeruginosa]|nr:hypothetical protein [Pseudomonas aeruginosa]